MSLLDGEAVARRTLNLFFLADVSGSMRGSKIGAVNDAIANVLPFIADISDNNPDAEIKVAAMTFSDTCAWVSSTPQIAADFEWKPQTANGGTALGKACMELASKLSKSHGFMNSGSGSYAPVVILLSDGGPTDDFAAGMAKLKENNWFKAAIKVAIAIGGDADKEVLGQFTGNSELVIGVHDIESLKKTIQVVTVTSTQVGSKSSSVSIDGKEQTKEDEVAQNIHDQLQGEKKIDIGVANTTINRDEFD